ncbi:ATPases [Thiohalobacter thiocyanaticus]|uniref:ATPases n=1 Tax=Thiohalobacter thiocyanaticus TaxID=585455 RepID=A0A1Z4VN37_9GAMM|nr:AAA family ATPase [Thiohalobacter thiocyanaticus]BAZ93029.1 ATPases [Thiohalobacter thiocyanaticus]
MQERHSAKRLAIYNHKGGVGKTTLTVNIAFALASRGKRVLLVDTDPQCNLTSYLVSDEVVDDLLDHSDGQEGATVWSAVKPIAEAEGDIKQIKAIERPGDIFLLPGDIRLSEFESELTSFWSDCTLRKAKGFRGTTAISRLVNDAAEAVGADYVFYDSGPNIGPLNRVILLDCEYFIIPAACDLFSLRALKTLGASLFGWITDWSRIANLAPEDTYLLPGRPKLLGYIPQGFRTYGGRPSREHAYFMSRLEKDVQSEVVAVLRQIDKSLAPGSMADRKLGEVKDYGVLISGSQRDGAAVFDGQGGTDEQRSQARNAFGKIANKIMARIKEIEK